MDSAAACTLINKATFNTAWTHSLAHVETNNAFVGTQSGRSLPVMVCSVASLCVQRQKLVKRQKCLKGHFSLTTMVRKRRHQERGTCDRWRMAHKNCCLRHARGHYECRCTAGGMTQPLTTLCRMCKAHEETIEHVVLRCPQLLPHPKEGATLPVALGFVHLSDDSEEASDALAGRKSSDQVTKWRLTQWWTAAHNRVKVSD